MIMSFVVGYSRIPRIASLAMILKLNVGRIVSEGCREIARVHCPSFANASFRKAGFTARWIEIVILADSLLVRVRKPLVLEHSPAWICPLLIKDGKPVMRRIHYAA